MGVLPCARRNCDRIMCDRYSRKHGYICEDCYQELLLTGPQDIEEFMESEKKDVAHLSQWTDQLDAEFQVR